MTWASGLPAQAACLVSWLLDPSDCITWQAWQDLAYNGHFWVHSYLVPPGQVTVYQGPILHQDLFLKRRVILCCRWHGLAPEPQGPPTRASLKLHIVSFSTVDTSGVIGSDGSNGLSGRTACITARSCCRALGVNTACRVYLCSTPDK